ncbi:MAG TPA: glycosyltransferase family 2 protein [Candidatus Omnitrophota bacterium]|nr:glycosyltransferase family 2 protein [Candidatus Omnitrophota bacterium]
MKFSVLLPTRNGGQFLKDCISSILDEPYEDMELVVSDNANTDETQDILKSFANDSRLKVLRLDAPVGVTENWNNALKASSGDYFLMMGDDDCLLPGYFKRMEDTLRKYDDPDCVIYNAYTYIAPGAINNRESYYNKRHFKFGPDFKKEGLVSFEQRFSIVRDMYRFRVRIPLNMQTTLVSHRAAEKYIKGDVFHPPFPDHYALNALLLSDARWVYLPENLLVVGVSPKSFGHFVYSNKQDKGLIYLGVGADFKGCLPGNELINHMHTWLNFLKIDYDDKLKGINISRANYVRRQVYYWCRQYGSGIITFNNFVARIAKLSFLDWTWLFLSIVDSESWKHMFRMLNICKKNDPRRIWRGLSPMGGVLNIREFRAWIIRKDKNNE